MSQHRKGDAALVIDGERRTLRLTLGALAALEDTLGEGDFASVAKRLERPSAGDLLIILQALLLGGGFATTQAALKAGDIDLPDAASAIAAAFRSLAPNDSVSSSSPSFSLSPFLGGEGRGEGGGAAAAMFAHAAPPPHPAFGHLLPLKEGEKEERAKAGEIEKAGDRP